MAISASKTRSLNVTLQIIFLFIMPWFYKSHNTIDFAILIGKNKIYRDLIFKILGVGEE